MVEISKQKIDIKTVATWTLFILGFGANVLKNDYNLKMAIKEIEYKNEIKNEIQDWKIKALEDKLK